jgi:hypothetical protein
MQCSLQSTHSLTPWIRHQVWSQDARTLSTVIKTSMDWIEQKSPALIVRSVDYKLRCSSAYFQVPKWPRQPADWVRGCAPSQGKAGRLSGASSDARLCGLMHGGSHHTATRRRRQVIDKIDHLMHDYVDSCRGDLTIPLLDEDDR